MLILTTLYMLIFTIITLSTYTTYSDIINEQFIVPLHASKTI
jgi:hypothetical protein